MSVDKSKRAREICETAPVIPVLIVEEVASAQPIAKALISGGLPVLEVTLRTDAALSVIEEMAKCEGAIVGAGTILTPDDLHAARSAGAQFGVSPGFTDALLDAAEEVDFPMLPGATTTAEIMHLADRGYNMMKFFPAEAIGGAAALKSLASPFPKITFCPTGGVNLGNVANYLSLPNVVCVGGSWVVAKDSVANGDWAAIEQAAKTASQLKG